MSDDRKKVEPVLGKEPNVIDSDWAERIRIARDARRGGAEIRKTAATIPNLSFLPKS